MSRRATTSVLVSGRHRDIWHRRKYDTEARCHPADFERTKEPRNARNAALEAGKARQRISPRAWAMKAAQTL